MDTLIIYLDDADYADHMLAPLLNQDASTRWVLVACAPRMSRRIGKWLSHSHRENWRAKWCEKLFAQITPRLLLRDDALAAGVKPIVECMVASGPLPALTQALRTRFGNARVVDARRPKFGHTLEAVTLDQPRIKNGWQMPSAVGSLSAVLVLASD
jgi:hypothetical protein